MNKFVITKNYLNHIDCNYLCILLDFVWWSQHIEELRGWCGEHGCAYEGMTVMIPDEPTSTLFTLRWL